MLKKPARIAIVDDDEHLLQSVRRSISLLRPYWELTIFTSPARALLAFEEQAFDVLLSDMRMPEMSGLELISAVRAKADLPCIILTGSPDLTSALYAINQADVFRFYTKPCDMELLVEGIEAGLASAQVEEELSGGHVGDSQSFGLTTQIGLAALNRLALGVLVVDRSGHVVFTNKSAGALLSEGDGLTVSADNTCRASTTSETKSLMDLVARAIDGSIGADDNAAAMALVRPSMKRPYSVFVTPLIPDQSVGPRDKLVALFISDPDKQPIPSLDHIMRLHGLSRSQALIVQNLASGLSVDEAAEAAGVTVSTARTYLKQVFSKTDTCRQSELLKLVLASPRVLAASLG